MFGSEFIDFSFWWICPVIMIVFCFFVMRRGKGRMWCGCGSQETGGLCNKPTDPEKQTHSKGYDLINKDRKGEIKNG